MDLISVLVPVYNVEKYIDRCLNSLSNQTYKNLEIVLINDGSTDGSLEICEKWQKKDKRIKIYSYENAGISTTRNRALERMTGNYLIFVDSDDWLAPKAIEKMYSRLKEKNANLCHCGFVMDYPFFRFYRRVPWYSTMGPEKALHKLVKNQGINNYPWGKLFSKECFDGVKFPEHSRGFEDTATIFKAIGNAKVITAMPNRFYHYVQHSGSLTNNMSLEYVYGMRKAYHEQAKELKKLYPNQNFDFNLNYFNTDMVLIYTLLFFVKRKDKPVFKKDRINFSKLIPGTIIIYYLWLLIPCIKFGWNPFKIERLSENEC